MLEKGWKGTKARKKQGIKGIGCGTVCGGL